jgi:hypothetical protein
MDTNRKLNSVTLQDEIRANLNNPEKMEKLYRENKVAFKQEFSHVYPQLIGSPLVGFWQERLNFDADNISWGSRNDLLFVALASLIAGLLAKIPAIFNISEDYFFPRNIGFIVFPFLIAYFVRKNILPVGKIAFLSAIIAICMIYINVLPNNTNSDTLILACIHLPFLLWALFSIAFSGNELKKSSKRLEFLRFNGDQFVMSALLVAAGGLMTGITLGLFELIGVEIQKFYGDYVIVFGLAAVPVIATHLTHTNPQLVSKVSPVIARLFSPVVLVMLVIYLGAIILAGKDPYNDREFLLLFNALLIGVMALIFFSVAESAHKKENSSTTWILLLLSVVTIVVNGIALSAIVFRISEWGLTPNRLAVLGSNALMLGHLLFVTAKLFRALTKKGTLNDVGSAVVRYMPVYIVWVLVVVFIFPLVFGFK